MNIPEGRKGDSEQGPPHPHLSEVVGVSRQRPQTRIHELALVIGVVLELEFLLNHTMSEAKGGRSRRQYKRLLSRFKNAADCINLRSFDNVSFLPKI